MSTLRGYEDDMREYAHIIFITRGAETAILDMSHNNDSEIPMTRLSGGTLPCRHSIQDAELPRLGRKRKYIRRLYYQSLNGDFPGRILANSYPIYSVVFFLSTHTKGQCTETVPATSISVKGKQPAQRVKNKHEYRLI